MVAKSNVTQLVVPGRKGFLAPKGKVAEVTKVKTKVGVVLEPAPKKKIVKAKKMETFEVVLNVGDEKVNSFVYRSNDKDDGIQSVYLMKSAMPDRKSPPKQIKITIEAVD